MSTRPKPELVVNLLLFASVVFMVKGYQSKPFFVGARLKPIVRDAKEMESSTVISNYEDFSSIWTNKPIESVKGSQEFQIECELEIINNVNEPIMLCWVDKEMLLHHHYIVNDKSILDNSVSNSHLEYSHFGHSFVCFKKSSSMILPKTLRDITRETFLFYTKLTVPGSKVTVEVNPVRKITLWNLRSRGNDNYRIVSNTKIKEKDDIIDISDKIYHDVFLHGFQLKCETNLFQEFPDLESCLSSDLSEICSLVPCEALKRLQQSTPIYFNKSLIYGPRKAPIIGNSVCYHPIGGRSWLEKHGLSIEKEGCIEVASIEDYFDSRVLWGCGGLLLHELSHAYHNKFCLNGYDCVEIREAYDSAMIRGLYEKVAVHGRGGNRGPLKAYACANAMEFFAELSVAFLYTKDSETEYNKWFPFNHEQLQQYDSDTFHILKRLWFQYETATTASP